MSELPAPFIVGVSRSGTTLLRLMLDSHPDLAIPFETHFLNKLAAFGDAQLSRDEFFDLVTAAPSWPNMGMDAADLRRTLDAIAEFSVTEGLRSYFRLAARRTGKIRWGDKTPHYLSWMSGIQRLLPEAHFIHLIRDGRDVALSFRGLWFGPGDDIENAARFWTDQVSAAQEQSAQIRHYMQLRYEDLILDARASLTRITDYLGLSFDPVMLDYHRSAPDRLREIVRPFGKNSRMVDVDQFKSIYATTTNPPDPSRVARWRKEMSDAEQQRFEAIAGPLLVALGYETRF